MRKTNQCERSKNLFNIFGLFKVLVHGETERETGINIIKRFSKKQCDQIW